MSRSRRRQVKQTGETPDAAPVEESAPVEQEAPERPEVDEEPEEAPEEDQEAPASATDAPEPAPEPPPRAAPVPTECPACGKPLRVIASKMLESVVIDIKPVKGKPSSGREVRELRETAVGFCAECGAEVARGAEVASHIGRVGILELAQNALGLVEADMIDRLPTAGAGGVKITHAGRGVKLYTTKGTQVWRLPMPKAGR